MVRFAARWWLPFALPVGAWLAILSLGSANSRAWAHPMVAFVVVVSLASLCAVGAGFVLVIGVRRGLAEVALLGCSLWAVSVLSVAHGLLLPGPLYGANGGTVVAVMAAVPAALLAALPLLLAGTRVGESLAGRWRAWTAAWTVLPVLAASAIIAAPRLIDAPPAGGALAVVVVALSLAGSVALSLRHLRLFAIGRRAGSLLASLGLLAPGLATIAFLGAAPMSPGWWAAHVTDIAGVLCAVAGLLWAHARDRSLALVLAPVLTRDPLAALELGLTPVVHRFIAALERKDVVTREHVIRVGELSMRAAERAGLPPLTLRAAGLGGLLHDVGKLLTPDEILSKPGRLTDAERATIERHTIDGEAMLAPYRHLVEVAAIVRSHHERPDGRGYPDGLAGEQIPLAASIVSVVDAWDAMVSDRPYRDGMAPARAEQILREGTGSQWPRFAVELVLTELHERGPVVSPALALVGRRAAAAPRPVADQLVDTCLPEQARAAAG